MKTDVHPRFVLGVAVPSRRLLEHLLKHQPETINYFRRQVLPLGTPLTTKDTAAKTLSRKKAKE